MLSHDHAAGLDSISKTLILDLNYTGMCFLDQVDPIAVSILLFLARLAGRHCSRLHLYYQVSHHQFLDSSVRAILILLKSLFFYLLRYTVVRFIILCLGSLNDFLVFGFRVVELASLSDLFPSL